MRDVRRLQVGDEKDRHMKRWKEEKRRDADRKKGRIQERSMRKSTTQKQTLVHIKLNEK